MLAWPFKARKTRSEKSERNLDTTAGRKETSAGGSGPYVVLCMRINHPCNKPKITYTARIFFD